MSAETWPYCSLAPPRVMEAYLVIREGPDRTDVFRLIPGESVTVGRAPTNQIVIKDERCSRNHAEIFYSQGNWTLRDLDSRNGTLIDGQPVNKDHSLQEENVICIGNYHLAFVRDLAAVLPNSNEFILQKGNHDGSKTKKSDNTDVLEVFEPTRITHRSNQSKFLDPPEEETESPSTPKVGQAVAQLCRLAFELAKSADSSHVANLALSGLFESTPANGGALLLHPHDRVKKSEDYPLEVISSRTDTDYTYQQVSNFLASTVMRDGQAVLARNVMDDSTLGIRDSQGEIHTRSVICAPIRRSSQVLGVIHLYSTDASHNLDPDDLEFTLAVADTVAVALENLSCRNKLAENLNQVRDQNLQLLERLGVQSEIVGSSPAMEKVMQEIAQAASSRATVLIRGESGVGKELVARAVHFSGPRRKAPFVCLNCAALSETLLESELFGHERGSFTGATERKIGKFESADKGTLMLDEIGEMSSSIQAKFLRVLEGHPFERVGGNTALKVDVRVIAATNRDLEKDVAEGHFRRDLYFRLHVLEIIVPALRKRVTDISELVHYFLQRYKAETGDKIQGISPPAMEALVQYRWPGNVRELKNVIERAIVLARGDYIEYDDLALSTLNTAGDTGQIPAVEKPSFEPVSLAEMERRHILATLHSTGWNKRQAAGILGIERSTLDRKIQRYSLNRNRHLDV